MPFPRRTAFLATLSAAALVLAGCPSLSERAGPPPSVDRAASLQRQGDQAGAARVYEELAGQNTGADRNGLLLSAARAWLAAHDADDAARVLGALEGTLSAEQQTERGLSNVELALERNQAQQAWQQISAMATPANAAQATRYRTLRARAATAAGHPDEAAAVAAEETEVAPHVALLLPVSGRTASASGAVRDGFLAAYYQAPAAERPRLRVYDTGGESVNAALSRAIQQGADLIVGPAHPRGGDRGGAVRRSAAPGARAEFPAAGNSGAGALLPVRAVAGG